MSNMRGEQDTRCVRQHHSTHSGWRVPCLASYQCLYNGLYVTCDQEAVEASYLHATAPEYVNPQSDTSDYIMTQSSDYELPEDGLAYDTVTSFEN